MGIEQPKHGGVLELDHSNDLTIDQKAALVGTSGAPSLTNRYVTNNDSRNVNARAPITHNQGALTINAGELDGDRLPAMSETKKGGVPATSTPSGKYLKDDSTWGEVIAFSGFAKISVGIDQPEFPSIGDLWIDTN